MACKAYAADYRVADKTSYKNRSSKLAARKELADYFETTGL